MDYLNDSPAASSYLAQAMPTYSGYADLSKIAAAQKAQGAGADGRTVLGGANLLSVLGNVAAPKYVPETASMGQSSGDSGGGDTTYTPSPAYYQSSDGKRLSVVDGTQFGDPNGHYYADTGDNPSSPGGKDVANIIYRVNPDGTATPVSANNSYNPSNWVDGGRLAAELAAAVGTAGVAGYAMAGAGAAGAAGGGAAAGAGAGAGIGSAGLTPALIDSGLGTAGYGASSVGAIAPGTVGAAGASGMDLAADAASGTGNSIAAPGSVSNLAPGSATANGVGVTSGATNPALIDSSLGTAGYGGSSAGAGGVSSGETMLNAAGNVIRNGVGTALTPGAASGAGGTGYGASDLIKAGTTIAGAVAANNATAAGEQSAADALDAQRRAADNVYALGEDSLDFQKQQYSDGQAARDTAAATANQVSQAQLQAQTQANQTAADYEAYRKTTFQPLEEGIVSDAEGYDTPEKRANAAVMARADVDAGFARTQDAQSRALAASGVNPSSARSIAALGGSDIEQAKAGAGASYLARKGVEDTATAMKLNAASLGRNLPANQNAATQTGVQAGTAAVTSATSPVTIQQNSGAGVQSGYNAAIGATTASGQLDGSNAALQAQSNNANSAAWNSLGSVLGSYFASSDENVKTGIKPVGDDEALEAVNATPVKKWNYKPSAMAASGLPMDDGSQHVGPMAQDVNANMGDAVAPGGKKIDLVSMNGINMKAVQAVDKKVDRLAKEVTSIAAMLRSGKFQAGARA